MPERWDACVSFAVIDTFIALSEIIKCLFDAGNVLQRALSVP